MIYLVLSVLFSTMVVLVFKFFEKYQVVTFHGIVVNYAVCFLVGCYFLRETDFWDGIMQQPWLWLTVVLGLLFISVFNAIGWVAQRVSVSASMVAAKMSVVIPILFAVVYLHESVDVWKVTGILLSLAALYFVVGQQGQTQGNKWVVYLFPLVVFMGSGAIDTIMKYLQVTYLQHTPVDAVLTVVFGVAFVAGLAWFFAKRFGGTPVPFGRKDLAGGVVLGIPNYFSMYFLLKSLHSGGMQATQVFPLNNIGIVLVSTLLALLLFQEKISSRGIVGIVLSVIAILLISR